MSEARALETQLRNELSRLGFDVLDIDSGTPPSGKKASIVGFTASSEGLPRDISGRRRHFFNVTVEILLSAQAGQRVERLFEVYDSLHDLRSSPPIRQFVVRSANVVQRDGNDALSVVVEGSFDR